jgi:hypothetical protein
MDETTRQQLTKLADFLDEDVLGDEGVDRTYALEHILWKLDTMLGQEPRARQLFDDNGNLM